MARVDSRMAKQADDLAAAMQKLDISKKQPGRVVRRGYGKNGTEVAVYANFFKLNFPDNAVLWDYPIEIKPPVKLEEKRLRKRLFALFDESPAVAPFLGGIAHDSAQRIIAVRQLPPNFSPVTIEFYEEGQDGPREGAKTYEVSVLEPNMLDTTELNK